MSLKIQKHCHPAAKTAGSRKYNIVIPRRRPRDPGSQTLPPGGEARGIQEVQYWMPRSSRGMTAAFILPSPLQTVACPLEIHSFQPRQSANLLAQGGLVPF